MSPRSGKRKQADQARGAAKKQRSGPEAKPSTRRSRQPLQQPTEEPERALRRQKREQKRSESKKASPRAARQARRDSGKVQQAAEAAQAAQEGAAAAAAAAAGGTMADRQARLLVATVPRCFALLARKHVAQRSSSLPTTLMPSFSPCPPCRRAAETRVSMIPAGEAAQRPAVQLGDGAMWMQRQLAMRRARMRKVLALQTHQPPPLSRQSQLGGTARTAQPSQVAAPLPPPPPSASARCKACCAGWVLGWRTSFQGRAAHWAAAPACGCAAQSLAAATAAAQCCIAMPAAAAAVQSACTCMHVAAPVCWRLHTCTHHPHHSSVCSSISFTYAGHPGPAAGG